MNTPAHLIFGAAAFARPDAARVTAAALFGALAPDLSLYLMAGTHLFLLGTPPEVVFGQLYFSDGWTRVFRVDNSAVLWAAGLAVAFWFRSTWGIAMTGAALLHIAFDLPLHAGDGRPHFWPLTDWIYDSPVSYWDSTHYGGVVGPLETVASVVLCVVLWRRFHGWIARSVIAAGATLQVAPYVLWAILFG